MSGYPWNYGDILEGVDSVVPAERNAFVHGERVISWGEFTRRSNNLAANLLAGGAATGDKIAFYLRNCPEYGEGIAAAFKARLTHVNVNYRYVDHELIYLLDNSDATVVIYGAEFASHVREIRAELPGVRQWIEVEDGYPGNEDVLRYDELVATGDGAPLGIDRSPDDMLFLYTGGTTGMPKGVMWRHEDLWCVTGAGGNPRLNIPPSPDLETYLERLGDEAPPVNLPLPPIMHGTGLLSAIGAMTHGGTCVTLTGRSFDAEEALAAIDRHRATAITIVGDAFARPMVETLDANPGKYDISSLGNINSSGVMWTRDIKAGLLRHNENLILADAFSSSEAIGLGASIMTKDEVIEVAKFTLGPSCKVFDEHMKEVGVGESGMGGRHRIPAGRVLQGRGENGQDLSRHRRGALFDPRRLGPGGDRRLADPARTGQQLHQHGRREGLSGRSGRSAEGPRVHLGCAGRGAAGREVGAVGERGGLAARGIRAGRDRPEGLHP